jgi:hypothetical protein
MNVFWKLRYKFMHIKEMQQCPLVFLIILVLQLEVFNLSFCGIIGRVHRIHFLVVCMGTQLSFF